MTTSVRMDPETERLLESLARERGSTKSEVVREALRLAARKQRRPRRSERPYDAFRGIVGSVRGGPPDLSERTGQRFRQLLVGSVPRSKRS
ncbi:MAG: type II toxin-antitoxin system VapB family antitoxin [Thermoanaerobaculia bacterium]